MLKVPQFQSPFEEPQGLDKAAGDLAASPMNILRSHELFHALCHAMYPDHSKIIGLAEIQPFVQQQVKLAKPRQRVSPGFGQRLPDK